MRGRGVGKDVHSPRKGEGCGRDVLSYSPPSSEEGRRVRVRVRRAGCGGPGAAGRRRGVRVWAGCCALNCLTRSEAGAFLRGTASTALKALLIPQWSHACSPPRSSFISCARARAGGWLDGLGFTWTSGRRRRAGARAGAWAAAVHARTDGGARLVFHSDALYRPSCGACVRGGSEARRGAMDQQAGAVRTGRSLSHTKPVGAAASPAKSPLPR